MENEFENKIENAMKKFEGKSVKITISGMIESKFFMNNLKYDIQEGILEIEDGDNAYLNIDIDDIENLYLEFTANGYAFLMLKVSRNLNVEIQVKGDNVIPLRDKIWKWMVESGVAEEIYNEICGA